MSYKARHTLYGHRKAKREYLKIPKTTTLWGFGRFHVFTCDPVDMPVIDQRWRQMIEARPLLGNGAFPELRKD